MRGHRQTTSTRVTAERRTDLSAIEMEMVTKCEQAAGRLTTRNVRRDDRGPWDSAMWNRYLSTAAALEPDDLPQMLRLHAEIERLDKTLLLPTVPEARAV